MEKPNVAWSPEPYCSRVAGPRDASRVGRSRDPEPGRARQTAAWVAAALQEFNAAVRNVRHKGDPDQLPGGRLVKLVLEWALQIFLIHRRAVRDNDEYRLRLRDPAELRAARAAPRRTEEQRADQSKKRAAQKRAAKAVPVGPAAKLATAKRRVAAKDARAAAKRAAKDRAAGGGLQIARATTRRQPQCRRKPPEVAASMTSTRSVFKRIMMGWVSGSPMRQLNSRVLS